MENRHTILLVDDERNSREGLALALRGAHDVLTAQDAATALQTLAKTKVDIVISDFKMPGATGMELLEEVRTKFPDVLFVMLTAHGSIEMAVSAMRAGAFDFLRKPVDFDELDAVLERADKAIGLKRQNSELQAQNRSLRRQLDAKFGMESIIGSSAAMQPVFDVIRAAAPTNATVLVSGPSGTGKELVAHAIHNLSRRSQGPFVAVNCAALPATLLESELFGHEKGAFTGAEARRKGRFELASGGTLFLDEIGEIDQATQVKLLRVLEDRKFERVGGTETIAADIRLVAATNKDLAALVAEGRFREDLYYRLAVVDIKLPPLCERADDIPAMAAAFLKEFAEKNDKAVDSMSPRAVDMLCAYPWPGNVRELRNTIEKMVVLAGNRQLGVEDVPAKIREYTGAGSKPDAASPAVLPPPGGGTLEAMKKERIAAVLKKHGGNRSRAALELGISRRTLIRKIAEYGLE